MEYNKILLAKDRQQSLLFGFYIKLQKEKSTSAVFRTTDLLLITFINT